MDYLKTSPNLSETRTVWLSSVNLIAVGLFGSSLTPNQNADIGAKKYSHLVLRSFEPFVFHIFKFLSSPAVAT